MGKRKIALMKKLNGFSLLIVIAIIVGCGARNSKSGDTTNDSVQSVKENVEETHGVDLGLSVNWAECNVGASEPQEFGLLTSYGNVEGRLTANPPAINISGTSKDIARVKLGDPWRMPTYDELLELLSECTWNHEEYRGVPGMRVKGPNGNSIFLPESGGYVIIGESSARNLSKIKNFDPTRYRDNPRKESYYWVGTVKGGFFPFLMIENGSNSYRWMYEMNGSCAFAVRPVADK
ncbi:MAG: hypothetical protein ACI3Y0_09765 [Prevotella sp.]